MKRFLTLALVCAISAGCSSMCKTMFPNQCGKTTPEVVYVTDYEPMEDLPLPPEPESKLDAVADDETDWRVWAEAIGVDFANWKAYAAALRHVIDSFNVANDQQAPRP